MKKLMLLAMFAVATLAVQAQSGCAGKSTSASVTNVSDEAAAQAASADATIDRRVCGNSGKVSYYRKDVCEKSGKVSFEQVSYDAAAGQFVNVSPTDVAAEKAACASKTSGKACCASKKGASASATSGSDDEKASCASKKAAGKACCSSKKGKGASASIQAEEPAIAPSAKKVNN